MSQSPELTDSSSPTVVRKADTVATPVRRLMWFNWLVAVLTVIPCCFGVYLPFLFPVILETHLRHLHETSAPDQLLTASDLLLVPWATAYSAQLIMLGIPSFTAAVMLRRNTRVGWLLSLGAVILQVLLLLANLAAFALWGNAAWKAMGSTPTAILFATEVVLLISNVILLLHAATALPQPRS
jgi:hypothetical protein